MGYMHINNLYKDQAILLFKECYALEKVHGTSAHIRWHEGDLFFFAGGCKHESFVALWDTDYLRRRFMELGHDNLTVYGEAYGGKLQGMSDTYGKDLRFIVFEVQIGDTWLGVDNADNVSQQLGLEFVPWTIIPATVLAIDAYRDMPSIVAEWRGMGTDKPREGVVLRPLVEMTMPNGKRVISKHKRDAFKETRTARSTAIKLEVLEEEKAALEWVTPMRLQHVLDAIGNPSEMSDTPAVMKAMLEDVLREGAGEIIDTQATRKAIGHTALRLWKEHVKTVQADALRVATGTEG